MGESPSASYSSFFTSSVTRDPRRSSRVGSNGGKPTSERVEGTNTWSCVMCPVEAWCFAWVTRHEWYGTPTLKEKSVSLHPTEQSRTTHAECKNHPTVLFTAFDSENA